MHSSSEFVVEHSWRIAALSLVPYNRSGQILNIQAPVFNSRDELVLSFRCEGVPIYFSRRTVLVGWEKKW